MNGIASLVGVLCRLPQYALIALVRFYRYFISPSLGANCPYQPTCSGYALQALQQHGAAAGAYLAAARIARCHPWCLGGPDPVPAHPPRLLSRWLPGTKPEHPTSTSS